MRQGIRIEKGKIIISRKVSLKYPFFKQYVPMAHWDKNNREWYAYLSEKSIDVCNKNLKAGLSMDLLKALDSVIVSFPFKTKPRKYQMQALNRASGREGFGFFMDPGLGKTKTTIDEIQILNRDGQVDNVLVICPKSVLYVWPKEIKIHGYDEDWRIYQWKEGLIKTTKQEPSIRWLLMNIDALLTKDGFDFAYRFVVSSLNTYMVIDESTLIKNIEAKRTGRAIKLGQMAKYKRVLSGTPIANTPMDLYSQFWFLDPEIVKSRGIHAFRNHFCIMGGYKRKQILGFRNKEALKDMVVDNAFAITKEQCVNLPPKIYEKRDIFLSPSAKKLYKEITEDIVVYFEEQTKGGLNKATCEIILTKMTKLQQVCGGGIKDDEGKVIWVDRNKLNETLALIEETGDKTLIWCQYVHEILELERVLKDKGYTVSILYGKMKSKERAMNINLFEDGPNQIFLLQNVAGHLGLTLNSARNAIFYSNNWSPAVRRQAEDRCHRLGQIKSVTYFDLIVQNTIDGLILRALERKESLINTIMEKARKDSGNFINFLNGEEI